ncbi:MAG: homoserine kinase [Nitrolancea sp.]
MRFNVKVPASSANLGSGFDTLAVALNLFTGLEVESADSGILIEGGPDLAGGDNMIQHGIELAARDADQPTPSCLIRVSSDIPVARGLGSSATALVAGLVAGNHLLDQPLSEQRLFELATEVEGHGDNVSASLFGGVTLSLVSDRGTLFRRVPVNGDLRVVVFIPDALAFTADARAVVPDIIPRRDAVANIGRSSLLILSLMQGDFSVFSEAMRDSLHQPYRAALFPHVGPMIDAGISAGAHGACLSGAGPSVLSLVDAQHAADVATAFDAVAQQVGVPGASRLLDIEYEGATILQPVGQRNNEFS